jgi:hypothetical protein
MTKTHAELLPCPHCGDQPELIEGGHYCKQEEHVISTLEICCHKCEVITFPCEEISEVVARWNKRINKEAEFLEELKKELKIKKKLLWTENPSNYMYTGGREWEICEMIEKIEQFQAEQKQVSDEKRNKS